MPDFDKQRNQLDQLDAKLRFQNEAAKAREQVGLEVQKALAKRNDTFRKLKEKFVQSQLLEPEYTKIDQKEAAYEAQQKGVPLRQPNENQIPVSANPSSVNPQTSGGPSAEGIANFVSGGGGLQSGDELGLNATDPTQGGQRVGVNYDQAPSGSVTRTSVSPMMTGSRGVDAINLIATALRNGRPLLKDVSAVEDPDVALRALNLKRLQAAAEQDLILKEGAATGEALWAVSQKGEDPKPILADLVSRYGPRTGSQMYQAGVREANVLQFQAAREQAETAAKEKITGDRQIEVAREKEGITRARPTARAADLEAQIMLDIAEGKPVKAEHRAFLDERQRSSLEDRIIRNVIGGIGGTQPIQPKSLTAETNDQLWGEFGKSLGRAPGKADHDAYKAFIRQRGFTLP